MGAYLLRRLLLIVPTLIALIWRFPARVRPQLLQQFAQWAGRKTVVHIRCAEDLEAFESTLRRPASLGGVERLVRERA